MMVSHVESRNMQMASSSRPPPSLHRIGIVMSPVGRFLQCRDCKLTFVFAEGAQYGTLAKQLESHLCISPLRISSWQIKSSVPDKPVASSERGFVILRYDGKVPAMASCGKCGRKFFTLATFARCRWSARVPGTEVRSACLRRESRRIKWTRIQMTTKRSQ